MKAADNERHRLEESSQKSGKIAKHAAYSFPFLFPVIYESGDSLVSLAISGMYMGLIALEYAGSRIKLYQAKYMTPQNLSDTMLWVPHQALPEEQLLSPRVWQRR